MIALALELFACVGLAGLAGGVGYGVGRRSGQRREAARLSPLVDDAEAQRRAAEERARELGAENARWRSHSLATQLFQEAPTFVARPAGRDAEALAGMIRDAQLVDGVLLVDAHGLSWTREAGPEDARLSALGVPLARLQRALQERSMKALSIHLEGAHAMHLVARPLPGRARGLFALVRTTSRPAQPRLLDAVVHACALEGRQDDSIAAAAPLRGSSERRIASGAEALARVIEGELGHHLSTAALWHDGALQVSLAVDGPPPLASEALQRALQELARRSQAALGGAPARVSVELHGGYRAALAPVDAGGRSSLFVLAPSSDLSEARVERMLGVLARTISLGARAEGSAA